MAKILDNDREFLVSLGARIAQIRHERGLTQEQVAEQAGIDPQTVQRAEVGRSALSLARLRVIAGVLGVTMPELFAEVGTAIPAPELDPAEIKVTSVWKKIPADRRGLALKVLKAFTAP